MSFKLVCKLSANRKLKSQPLLTPFLSLNVLSYEHECFLCSAKSARLKQAKEEAEREIAEYRAQMEAEFQRKVAEVRTPPHPVPFSPHRTAGPHFYVFVTTEQW